jgi:hypothetical protein
MALSHAFAAISKDGNKIHKILFILDFGSNVFRLVLFTIDRVFQMSNDDIPNSFKFVFFGFSKGFI